MVKHKGLCPSLKKSVEFDVKEIIELPTKRGIKYQVKGDFEGRTCSTFCSKAKAMELKKALGLGVMEAESEDGTGQAHQEEGVSPIENNVQPLAQGQEPMESMPVQETVSTPITNTSIGVEPIENLDLTDADALNNMTTEFDEAPQMVADIEIAPSEPEGDGRSIGNIRPMNEDVPLHAESEDGTGQAHQEEGVSPIENNVQPLAQGQEPMEAMPVQETVSTPITNTSIGVEPIDNLGLDGGADVIGSMITEFDDAPEILANFQIGMMQPFGEGRSIGNNTPMNPDVPLHAEEFKAEAEIEIIDPTDNTTLPTPPPVCFVDKIPPSVWGNLSVLEKIHYAETGDESILLCPNCGISKEQLRLQDGFGICGDCAYQKYFAPSHWITEPMIVANITEDEIELSERLPADVDMPSMKNPQKDLQTMIVPYFVWDKIYTQFTGGIKAEQDLSGLNYVLTYHGMMKPQLDNAIEVAEGEYDIMFGAERYQAQVFKAENNQGYYLDAETVIPLTKKGKVRTMSGKPHTPRELKEDKDITPEEALMRKEMKAEEDSDCDVCGKMFDATYLNLHPSTLYTTCYDCFQNELEEDDEGWVDVEELNWEAEEFGAETFEGTDFEGNSAVIRQLNSQFRRLRFLGMLLGDDVKSLNDLNKKMDMTHPSLYVKNRSSDKSYLTWLTNEQITEELGLNKENLKQLHDEWGVKLGSKLQEMIFDLSYTIHDRMTSKQTHYGAENMSKATTFAGKFNNGTTRKIEGVNVTKVQWNKYALEYKGKCALLIDAEIGDGYWKIHFMDKDDFYMELHNLDNIKGDWDWIWKKYGHGGTSEVKSSKEGALVNFKYIVDKHNDGQDITNVYFGANAETFDVEFDDWAEQEMLTHGKTVSFKEWAKEEGKKHGDMDLTDWAEHEEESHDERYEAEYVKQGFEIEKEGSQQFGTYYIHKGENKIRLDYDRRTDYGNRPDAKEYPYDYGEQDFRTLKEALNWFDKQINNGRMFKDFEAETFGAEYHQYVYVGDDELAKVKGYKWCLENDRDVQNWIIPEHEPQFITNQFGQRVKADRYEAEVVQYDVLKGKPNQGGVEYAEYISIHDSVNEAEKEARRESKNIAEDEAIYVVEERFDDETLESKPSNLMFSIEKPLMEDEMSDNFEAEILQKVGLIEGNYQNIPDADQISYMRLDIYPQKPNKEKYVLLVRPYHISKVSEKYLNDILTNENRPFPYGSKYSWANEQNRNGLIWDDEIKSLRRMKPQEKEIFDNNEVMMKKAIKKLEKNIKKINKPNDDTQKQDIPSLKSVGLLLGIGALGAYLAPQNIRNFFNNLNK